MKRFTVSALVALLAALSFSTAFAVEHHGGEGALPGQMPGIAGELEGAQAGVVHSAGKLIGLPVQDQQGEQIGQLQDVLVDLNQNQIGYGVIEVEGSQHLVPWASITSDHEGASLTLNADRQTVVASPMAPSPEQIDENLGRQVHEQFGVSPYWEEQDFMEQPFERRPEQAPAQDSPIMPGQ